MDELLTHVLDAHGGLANWSKVQSASAALAIGGPCGEWRGRLEIYRRQAVTAAAAWNYFTAPFVLTEPGVEAREIEPWQEDGQTWRRLSVTFPEATHNREQVFYYDHDFYQRRMDCQPVVTGNPIAHYTHNPQYFDGFLFYTLRLVHLRAADNVADRNFAPITIDIESVTLTRD